MSDFWPQNVFIDNLQTPIEIIEEAKNAWLTNSKGILQLVLQKSKNKSNDDLIIIHVKHVPTNRTATLFTLVHRAEHPYPVTIIPRENELPDYLKKSYYLQSMHEMSLMGVREGRNITNRWVSDTPVEFREKLKEAMNLGSVKSEIINLTCVSGAVGLNDTTEDPLQDN